jgi:methionyl-tRNA formyltransferase
VTHALRVAYLGNADWSVPPLEALHASRHPIALVLTRDARPAGRGHRLRRTPVAEAAERLGVPLVETPKASRGEGLERLADSMPDVIAVVAFGEILPDGVLAMPALMPVNLHFSLLPRWRGAAPVERAILAGDTSTGVTTMRMTAGLDEGPILLRREAAIGAEESAGELGARLAIAGAALLVETLDLLAAGRLDEHPQDPAGATYAHRLAPSDRRIDWRSPAGEIVRRVRAFAPAPGATATFRGEPLKVIRARVDPASPTRPAAIPGVIETVGESLSVATGDGWIELIEVAPAGRPRMSGAAFVRGHRPERHDFDTE